MSIPAELKVGAKSCLYTHDYNIFLCILCSFPSISIQLRIICLLKRSELVCGPCSCDQTSVCGVCWGFGWAPLVALDTLICISSFRRFWALCRWLFIRPVGLVTAGLGGGTGLALQLAADWGRPRNDITILSWLPSKSLRLRFLKLVCISNFR